MIMPSEMESFGLAALEGMACMVPAIATRVGGVPELIEHNINGLLYDVGDLEGMAAGALKLLTNPNALDSLARTARRTAQDHFCASRIIPLYEQFYEKILNS
jgi:glycosyltransferase involved in cell wall biosynthesis